VECRANPNARLTEAIPEEVLEKHLSVLHLAAIYSRDGAVVETLLDSKASVGRTLLNFCAQNDHIEAMDILIRRRADVNQSFPQSWNCPPLFLAVSFGNIGACRLLLDRRADLSRPCDWGPSALHACLFHGHAEVAELLLE